MLCTGIHVWIWTIPFHSLLLHSFAHCIHTFSASICVCACNRAKIIQNRYTRSATIASTFIVFDFVMAIFCTHVCVCVLSEILWTFTELMRIFNTFILDKSIYFDIYRVNNDFKPRKMSIHSNECLIKKNVCSFVRWCTNECMHRNTIMLSNATNPIQFHDCVQFIRAQPMCAGLFECEKSSKEIQIVAHTHMSRITHIRLKELPNTFNDGYWMIGSF